MMKFVLCGLIAPVLAGLSAANPEHTEEYWYNREAKVLEEIRSQQPIDTRAKNIILFIGDGMGVTTITASRIFAGQQLNSKFGGEEHQLAMDKLPYSALSKTYTVNQQTSDSAPTATAILSGLKTKDGMIGVGPSARSGDYASVNKQNRPDSILHIAKRLGKSAGIVTTTTLTHATPGSCYAHSPERGWESDANIYSNSRDAFHAGYPDIARQLIEFSQNNNLPPIDVALGGGRAKFLPRRAERGEPTGERLDNRDLTREWRQRFTNSAYASNRSQLMEIDPQKVDHLLGLFSSGHLSYNADRDTNRQPSLVEMTRKAMQVLEKNDKGYFLMVEGGRIDHGHHAGNAYRALSDCVAFDEAIQYAMENTDPRETLIIVTADHSHTMTMSGYAQRGNPILGLVRVPDEHGHHSERHAHDKLGRPFTSVLYANGPGYTGKSTVRRTVDGREREVELPEGSRFYAHEPQKMFGIESGRPKLTDEIVLDKNYLQEAVVPLGSETHGGEDVAIFAGGPQAHLFRGVREQNYIFHVMKYAFER